eukprot:6208221-Pleurochrysis_carterae.AAC.3
MCGGGSSARAFARMLQRCAASHNASAWNRPNGSNCKLEAKTAWRRFLKKKQAWKRTSEVRAWKRTSCFARAAPTRRERRVHPPADGIRPKLTSGNHMRAPEPKIRQSHARAHSKPPPTAAPSTTAMERKGASAI